MDDDRVPPERMRASDADRDAAAARLSAGLREGRLDLDEFDDRLAATMRATTMGDLAALTADLPEPAEPQQVDLAATADPPTRSEAWRRRIEPWRGPIGVSFLFIAIWAATSLLANERLVFWPMIPIGIMFIFTLAGTISGDDRGGNHGPGTES
ncbi:uncharacterized protein DUF1707 [Murinocardiopsis flavida]|uniref:Uncharacterized protein DUF1707 n=1 Tax=Murinocardiopsis flavida TaxID=645275 RepID=A0A2P8DTY1_9ACTN|nr:DUF1707 domain-containing protein [Murinocardiopsis flavida]PSL00652.1 uncharacterized protein DUF1707 [Murinocardiopsis flavida]